MINLTVTQFYYRKKKKRVVHQPELMVLKDQEWSSLLPRCVVFEVYYVFKYLDKDFCYIDEIPFLPQRSLLHRKLEEDSCKNEIDPEKRHHKSLDIGAKVSIRSSFHPLQIYLIKIIITSI